MRRSLSGGELLTPRGGPRGSTADASAKETVAKKPRTEVRLRTRGRARTSPHFHRRHRSKLLDQLWLRIYARPYALPPRALPHDARHPSSNT